MFHLKDYMRHIFVHSVAQFLEHWTTVVAALVRDDPALGKRLLS